MQVEESIYRTQRSSSSPKYSFWRKHTNIMRCFCPIRTAWIITNKCVLCEGQRSTVACINNCICESSIICILDLWSISGVGRKTVGLTSESRMCVPFGCIGRQRNRSHRWMGPMGKIKRLNSLPWILNDGQRGEYKYIKSLHLASRQSSMNGLSSNVEEDMLIRGFVRMLWGSKPHITHSFGCVDAQLSRSTPSTRCGYPPSSYQYFPYRVFSMFSLINNRFSCHILSETIIFKHLTNSCVFWICFRLRLC